ncbi:1-deoxy-D-xylulose-5-phosphate reductoisomerase [Pelosinus propionicus]|uniref:1-deoxy-D-xylulose 5-phosphate reductoisomerase n=1 Tax=Pelosinus propionicus DSM 13327 TaxID=1123291 RepID=A0A1I4K1U3_9FIRM|nr:1-deoxy-D-xylulose-5-phosphate reductoisomerase [Pelosinus propionicus]SFL72745.1 1-deoxy-D-xylulose 5-phosphate reductoisomerase [Pelosinus propionicus DSM 13327]
MKSIAILGSTGSIGTQSLEVIAANQDQFCVSALAAYHNDILLEKQIEYFKPKIAVLVDKNAADRLIRRYSGSTIILAGEEGLLEAAVHEDVSTVLTSLVGFAGLKPTLKAIKAGKNIALANKETLVAAGELVTQIAKDNHVKILPVDSEHSAIFQCLQGENSKKVNRILLTASGGPFHGLKREELEHVTIEDCLRHPNWSMGKKITVDSSTLANKGLEVIEARWLFDISYSQIEVVVHRQSIIHSMVEFVDGSVMAQLGKPDMRVPIQYALTYPERSVTEYPKLDFKTLSALTFSAPDMVNFPILSLAFIAGNTGGTLPCVFNAANEEAVYAFLQGKIRYLDIFIVIRSVMESHEVNKQPDLNEIYSADLWSRAQAQEIIKAI